MDGYEIAERLGLEAFLDMGGDDGTAYCLEDGGILKNTGSKVEAALAFALMHADELHPCLPKVRSVHAYGTTVLGPDDRTEFSLTRYAVVREDFGDTWLEGEAYDAWKNCLNVFNHGWYHDDEAMVARAVSRWTAGPELKDVRDGLLWLRSTLGVKLFDVRAPNIGESRNGRHGMRDWSRGIAPRALIDALDELPALPEAAPTFSP